MAACDVIYGRGTERRPKYVAAGFPGGARIFPQALADGREPFFLGYQQAWLEDANIMLLAEKSRQIGWTWATGYGTAQRHSMQGYTLDTWGTSRDDLQAMLAVQDCKAFADVLHAGAEDLGERVLDDRGSKGHVLAFANGTKYYSLSSNPNAQAGKRGNRIGDEFALNKDNKLLYGIMEPGTTWGGSIWIFSTHRGTNNYFNTLLQEARHKGNPKGWHVFRVTLQDALECGFLYKLQKKLATIAPGDPRIAMDEAAYFDWVKARAPDEETFLQEYMCEPSDDASAFISYDLLDACKYAPGVDWETDLAEAQGELYMGVDVGRRADLTVMYIVEKISGVYFTRRLIRMRRTRFAEQRAALYSMLDMPNMRRCCIDDTGIGMQLAEEARERYRSKVEPVTFTARVKEGLAYPLRAALEDRTLHIPDDDKLVAAFRSIRKETTAAGNVRFAGERGADGHADEFWAAALAIEAGAATAVPAAQSVDMRGGGGGAFGGRRSRRSFL